MGRVRQGVKGEKRVTVGGKVPVSVWRAVRGFCRDSGITPSALVASLVGDWRARQEGWQILEEERANEPDLP